MSCENEIGLSRKQRVFVVLEGTCGTLQMPTATDFVRPAGDAKISQSPAFVDSEEKLDTLDVVDRFEGVMAAAEWELPMYIRTSGPATSTGPFNTPQGDPLFQSLQGIIAGHTAGTINTSFAANALILEADCTAATSLPEKGVILLPCGVPAPGAGFQLVYYGTLNRSAAAGTCSFADLTWSYNSSTPHTGTNNVTLFTVMSHFYRQRTSAVSFSVWVETDHFVQGLSGATVDQMVLGINNEGVVTGTFSGKGMEMVWAGCATATAQSVAGVGTITVSTGNSRRFSEGARIYNTNATSDAAGHEITDIDTTTGIITFTPVIPALSTWNIDDVIRGFLPAGTTIGTPIESQLSNMQLDDVDTKYKGGDLTIGAPKEYITDEIGIDFAEDYLENVREITSTLDLYFRRANARYFADGYSGNYVTILLTFGTTQGRMMEIYFPRVSLEVPTIDFAAPAVNLSIPMKAIGTSGEDSCEIYFH